MILKLYIEFCVDWLIRNLNFTVNLQKNFKKVKL